MLTMKFLMWSTALLGLVIGANHRDVPGQFRNLAGGLAKALAKAFLRKYGDKDAEAVPGSADAQGEPVDAAADASGVPVRKDLPLWLSVGTKVVMISGPNAGMQGTVKWDNIRETATGARRMIGVMLVVRRPHPTTGQLRPVRWMSKEHAIDVAVVDEPAEKPEVVAGGGSGAASGGGEVVADKKPIDPRVLEALRVAWTVDLSDLKANGVPSAAIFIADDDRLAFSFEDEFRAALEAPEWDGWRSFVVDEFVLERPDGQQIIVGPVCCKAGEDPIAGRSLVFFAIDVSVPKSGYDSATLAAEAHKQLLRDGRVWASSSSDLEVFRSAEQAFALKQAKAEKAALSSA